jgi:site-specific DNA-cytosine methylase
MSLNSITCSKFLYASIYELRTNLDHVIADLEKCGYSVRTFLLNSEWFGLPQKRLRVYLVGVRNNTDVLAELPLTILDNTEKALREIYLEAPPAAPILTALRQCQLSCF